MMGGHQPSPGWTPASSRTEVLPPSLRGKLGANGIKLFECQLRRLGLHRGEAETFAGALWLAGDDSRHGVNQTLLADQLARKRQAVQRDLGRFVAGGLLRARGDATQSAGRSRRGGAPVVGYWWPRHEDLAAAIAAYRGNGDVGRLPAINAAPALGATQRLALHKLTLNRF